MADRDQAILKDLARNIQLADTITKIANEAQSFKQDCQELQAKTEKLAVLLRQVARVSSVSYQRPTRRIVDDTEQVLDKAMQLVVKCRANGILKRVFTIIPAAAFRKTLMQLENSLGDVSWLIRVSASSEENDDEYLGLPPIAANEPILCLIWEQIAILHTGSMEEKCDAAASLVSLARDNDRYGKLIIEEGGVPPLLKLAYEGELEGQENAARAIGLLGRDEESVEQIVNAGVCSTFAKNLKDGHMKVQSVVAWAVSELASNHPKCQDHFAQNNIVRFLVSHLAFETVQEHSKYAIASKQNISSLHSALVASNSQNPKDHRTAPPQQQGNGNISKVSCPMPNQANSSISNVVTNTIAIKTRAPTNAQQAQPDSHMYAMQPNHHNQHQDQQVLGGTSTKGRESEDPTVKAQMKAMAARALWKLSKGNLSICRNLTESRALLCFAVLLEKGPEDVKYFSAMALMEITAVAEKNSDLRRSAFKPTSTAAKAVLEQLLHIVEKADSDLLIPSIRAIGNLARTFRATETRIIGPLVNLLDEREPEVIMEATVALNKFATTENYLSETHSKAIINAGGVKHLIQLVYFGEQMIQIPALTLLCYIAIKQPESKTLAQEEVLIVLEWSFKQAHLVAEPSIEALLPEAKSTLATYQSRDRPFH